MPKRYSIAEARKHLPGIVDQAGAGADIELTRRGKPVAVLVSVHEYQRMKEERPRFEEAYESFVKRFPLADVGIDEDFAESVRDTSAGRRVDL